MNGVHMGPHRKSLNRAAGVALALLILSCAASGQDDRATILQAVIDHPALAQYYHADAVPGRKPLVIILDNADPKWRLQKFGEPVVILERKSAVKAPTAFLDITAIDVAGPAADVRFEYRAEGLHGRFRLQKSDSWQVVDVDLKEK